jgi:hypothetical protein
VCAVRHAPPKPLMVYDSRHGFCRRRIARSRDATGCAYPLEKSHTLAVQIHNAGKGIVWSGAKEVAELKRDQIRSAGPGTLRRADTRVCVAPTSLP